MTTKTFNIVTWILRLVAAAIMLQTLFFKFTAAPESVYIFTKLNMEPWGRIGIGCFELIASILTLIPKTTSLGALLGLGIMAGAIFFHITQLGLVVQNDGGKLFILAMLVFSSCTALLLLLRRQLISFIPFKL
ncbi:DoxX family protein [Mucilaginibacter terrae]|uniref:DoxX family protein n=1 Tax=Mucilaginibacter terrae TaxID=1955052 RepID=UPI003640DD99